MVLMMGTKDEDMPSMPVEKTKFVEDMDEHELNKALEMPAGIYYAYAILIFIFKRGIYNNNNLTIKDTFDAKGKERIGF